MNKEKVTMEMIAKKLGTSKSVVSIALSNKYGVSEQMRSRILLAAHEMGYDFTKSKKYRKKQVKCNKITLVIANKMVLSETFWSDIILGIESAANQNNVYLQVFIFNMNMRFEDMLSEIHNSDTNGLILIKDYDNALVSKLKGASLPMVVVDPKHFTDVSCTQISVSNYDSAYSCGKYFIDRGHKAFGFVGDISFSYSFIQRYNGFRDSVMYGGKDYKFFSFTQKAERESVVCNLQSVREAFSKPGFPTAVLCANDIIAYMIKDLLDLIGLKIPDDVSVIGFDNLEKSEWLGITSVNVPKFEMGCKAVEKILQLINNKDSLPEKIEIAAELVERNSVKRLN
jgi:DNA-binding LacI/PurR family transcriptional regulator